MQMDKLFQVARQTLADTTRRAMAALEPIKVVIGNFAEEAAKAGEGGMTFDVQNSPTDASLGSHSVTLTETMYIDSEDFRLDGSQFLSIDTWQTCGSEVSWRKSHLR